MAQIETFRDFTPSTIYSTFHDFQALATKVVGHVRATIISRCRQMVTGPAHKTFVESNLLDGLMGPEISRALRR